MTLPLDFLPGAFRITRGCWRDYRTLARFHYRPSHPRIPLQIWAVRYRSPRAAPRLAAVAVVSHPMRFATGRRQAIGLRGTLGDDLRFINRHLRTISRVIVHPQFRGLGLSSRLVRCVCKHCDTPYLEALAQMGRSVPFFERGGMKRFDPSTPDGPVYYLYKSRKGRNVPRSTPNGSKAATSKGNKGRVCSNMLNIHHRTLNVGRSAFPSSRKEPFMKRTHRRIHRIASDWQREDITGPRPMRKPDDAPPTPRQIRFLEDCLTTPDPFEQVMKRFGLSSRHVAEWLCNRLFVFRMQQIQKTLEKRRRGVVVGVQSPTWHRRAGLTLARLVRDFEARRSIEQGTPLAQPRLDHGALNLARRQRQYRKLMRRVQSL